MLESWKICVVLLLVFRAAVGSEADPKRINIPALSNDCVLNLLAWGATKAEIEEVRDCVAYGDTVAEVWKHIQQRRLQSNFHEGQFDLESGLPGWTKQTLLQAILTSRSFATDNSVAENLFWTLLQAHQGTKNLKTAHVHFLILNGSVRMVKGRNYKHEPGGGFYFDHAPDSTEPFGSLFDEPDFHALQVRVKTISEKGEAADPTPHTIAFIESVLKWVNRVKTKFPDLIVVFYDEKKGPLYQGAVSSGATTLLNPKAQ